MAIIDRNLTAGTVLKARYKGALYTCEVQDVDGKLVYALSGKGLRKKTYPSLGQATTAITVPKVSPNGWAWWTRAEDFAAGNGHKAPAKATTKAVATARKPAAKKAPAVRRSARRVAPDKAVTPRKPFACGECGTDYEEQEEANACLDSHRAEAEGAQEIEPQVAVEA